METYQEAITLYDYGSLNAGTQGICDSREVNVRASPILFCPIGKRGGQAWVPWDCIMLTSQASQRSYDKAGCYFVVSPLKMAMSEPCMVSDNKGNWGKNAFGFKTKGEAVYFVNRLMIKGVNICQSDKGLPKVERTKVARKRYRSRIRKLVKFRQR